MELLILDTSKYDDPFSEVWHANPRYTVSFLRGRGVDAAVRFVPVLDDVLKSPVTPPLALYFEISDENVAASLDVLPSLRCSLPDSHLFVGGAMASKMAEPLLRGYPEIDGVVVGECDETLARAIVSLKARRPIKNISGLCVRGATFYARPLMANLDDLGTMCRDGLDEFFRRSLPSDRVAYLLAGRGCYADCSFCSVPDFLRSSTSGKRRRLRSVGVVVDEVEAFIKDFGVRRFVFQDDNFFDSGRSGQSYARELAGEILRRNLEIEYFVTCRINDVNPDTLRIMKASGLSRLGIGVESLNQASLSLFNKGYRADDIYPALEIINDIGIVCEVNLIFFEPTMNVAGVRRNLDFIKYVEEHERLTYSDGFPFKSLEVAPWSRVAMKLADRGALDSDGRTCRFKDPLVAALAEFAKRLHTCMPAIFKQRVILASRSGLEAQDGSAETLRELASRTARIREWLGLTILPSYMRAACDLVENHPDEFRAALAELEASFDRQMAVLRRLGRRIEEVVAGRVPDSLTTSTRLPDIRI